MLLSIIMIAAVCVIVFFYWLGGTVELLDRYESCELMGTDEWSPFSPAERVFGGFGMFLLTVIILVAGGIIWAHDALLRGTRGGAR